jgi:dolichol-phosphate mannosyltransferase
MRALVIIPTFNERENIESLGDAVLAQDERIDLLIVDDGSPDGTGDIADAMVRASGRVHVLHRAGKQGLGTAYVAGFQYALAHRYDLVIEMDADYSHRPEDLPRLIAASDAADVVVGSRNVPGGRAEDWSWLRHLVSKGGSLYARLLLGIAIKDCTSGFKCFRRGAIELLDLPALRSNGYAFQVEVNHACSQAGLRMVEVPIVFPDRVRGRSKMSWHIAAEAAWLVLRLRLGITRAPLLQLPAAPSLGVSSGRTP